MAYSSQLGKYPRVVRKVAEYGVKLEFTATLKGFREVRVLV
jgi:hypothetical protein